MKQIRDLDIIEKELSECPVGILAICIEEEKIIQVATQFLYRDKNIYLFLDESSEHYQSINFECNSSFAVINNGGKKRRNKQESGAAFKSFAVIISGSLKKLEEQKVIDEVKAEFLAKYNNEDKEEPDVVKGKAVMIDTEEIQAVEENGG